MAYRVELSETSRAGCQDSFCKKDAVKILKGELRLGTLVEIMGNSSLRFKHWGCVSGFQLQKLRESMQGSIEVPANGEYNWDFFDGLSDLPQNLQEKIKTAIREGKISDEDFKGDPEFNHLGAKGIRSRPKKKKPAENETGEENAESSKTPKTPAAKKRGRAKKKEQDGDDDQEDSKPIKKRAKKVQKEEDAKDDAQNNVKPAKKRDRPGKKEEDVKEETVDDEALAPLTNKSKGTGKQVAKKEESDVKNVEDAEDIADIKPARKSRAKKVDPNSEPDDFFKQEDDSAEDFKPAKKVRGKRAVKNEDDYRGGHVKMEDIKEADADAKNTPHTADAKDAKSRKTSRSKKSVALSTRSGDVKMENIPAFNGKIDKMEDDDSKPVAKSRGKPTKVVAKEESGPKTKPQTVTNGGEDQIEDDEVAKEEESAAAAPPMKTARKGKRAGPAMATAANSRPRRGKVA